MGLFDFFKKKQEQTVTNNQGVVKNNDGSYTINAESVTIRDQYDNVVSHIDSNGKVNGICLEKKKAINLRKESVNKICLTKTSLSDLTARVVFAIDYSGSMRSRYNSGKVQELVERILPVSLRFDDDGEMGVWMFDDIYRRLPDMTMDNFHGYVKTEIMKFSMGGTNYAGVMNDIVKQYTKKEPADIPTYVVFITDGDCWDSAEAEKAIKNASKYNIFWQFVGIGNDDFAFLKRLDDMSGRVLDNADFFPCNDISKISDEELYKRLLNEFDSWVVNARARGMIK